MYESENSRLSSDVMEERLSVVAYGSMSFHDQKLGLLFGEVDGQRRTIATEDLDYHQLVFAALCELADFDIDPAKYPAGTDSWPDTWNRVEDLEFYLVPENR